MAKVIPRTDLNLARASRAAVRKMPARWRLPIRFHALSAIRRIEPEIHHLGEIVPTGLAVDIGASHGLYSYALSRMGREVVAFEPQPWCAETLRAWSDDRPITVHEIGLSDRSGSFTLNIPVHNGTRFTGFATFQDVAGEYEQLEVSVRRLDEFGLSGVGFIKIDVEGHEAQVLRGAAETIRSSKPVLLVEISELHCEDGLDDIFAQIEGYGYEGSFLLDGSWRALGEFSSERHQRAFADGDLSAPYIVNFLFRPARESGQ